MTNPFAPRLTFAFRCAIFADHVHRGTSYPVLGKAFGVNEQTVSKICRSKNSRLYHSVYLEFDRLGIEKMWDEYVKDGGVLSRIDDAAWERKVGTKAPVEQYLAGGAGRYWIKNINGEKVALELEEYEDIKDQTDPIYAAEFRHGIWFKDPQMGWTFEERPFRNFQDALRYFAEFPPTWGK